MTRIIALSLLAVGALAFTAHAQTPKTPTLEYRVQTGGLLAGVFTAIEIPAIGISLTGNDVNMVAQSGPKDGRPVKLTAGSVKDFTYKKLKTMVGQQMSVRISVTVKDGAPGKRCKIILNHAKLDKLDPDHMTFKPSETPKFECN